MEGEIKKPNLPDNWEKYVLKAATTYGTPLYVYFPEVMEANLSGLRDILPECSTLFYSIKANPNPWIIRFFHENNLGIEAASYGELSIAYQADVPSKDIIFVGPAKTNEELSISSNNGLQAIVVESPAELFRLAHKATSETPVSVVLRLNIGRFGGKLSMSGDTQFGMSIQSAQELLLKSSSFPSIKIIGIHTYAGTQRFSPTDVFSTCKELLEAATYLQKATSVQFSFLDFGGGFGTAIRKGDLVTDWSPLKKNLAELFAIYRERHPWIKTFAFEAGRYLLAQAGVLVTTVQDVKSFNNKNYILLDGGIEQFGFDDRYFGRRPPAVSILKTKNNKKIMATVCGPLCTPADRIADNIKINNPTYGDRICIFNTGAYGLTANPGLFLGRGFAAEVFINKNIISPIRRRFSSDEFSMTTTSPEELRKIKIN